jgi:hypothetical protein
MNKKLEILHALNIISFLLVVTFIYGWHEMILIHVMLALEIIVFGFGIRFTLRLRDYGEDDDRRRLFQKSRWYMLFSLVFIAIYFFILYTLS